jgi:glyoxylase-like metal-dependent hydrolase (beta-lactamase superfamily II)
MTITVHPFLTDNAERCGYVVVNPEAGACAIIDAPLNGSARLTACADQMLGWIKAHDFVVRWVIETHPHEQGSSALDYLRNKLLCAQTAAPAEHAQPQLFDQLLRQGDKICLGHSCARVLVDDARPDEIALQFDNKLFVSDMSQAEQWLENPSFGMCAANRVFVARPTLNAEQLPKYCVHLASDNNQSAARGSI